MRPLLPLSLANFPYTPGVVDLGGTPQGKAGSRISTSQRSRPIGYAPPAGGAPPPPMRPAVGRLSRMNRNSARTRAARAPAKSHPTAARPRTKPRPRQRPASRQKTPRKTPDTAPTPPNLAGHVGGGQALWRGCPVLGAGKAPPTVDGKTRLGSERTGSACGSAPKKNARRHKSTKNPPGDRSRSPATSANCDAARRSGKEPPVALLAPAARSAPGGDKGGGNRRPVLNSPMYPRCSVSPRCSA